MEAREGGRKGRGESKEERGKGGEGGEWKEGVSASREIATNVLNELSTGSMRFN